MQRAGLATPEMKDSALYSYDQSSHLQSERLHLPGLYKPGEFSGHPHSSDMSTLHDEALQSGRTQRSRIMTGGSSSIWPVRPQAPIRELEVTRSHSLSALQSVAVEKGPHDLYSTTKILPDSPHLHSTLSSTLHDAGDPRTPSTAPFRPRMMRPFDHPPSTMTRTHSQLAEAALQDRLRQQQISSGRMSSYQRHIDTGMWDTIQPASSQQQRELVRESSGHQPPESALRGPKQSSLSFPSHQPTESIPTGSLLREILSTEPTTEGSYQMQQIANERWKHSARKTPPTSPQSQSREDAPSHGATAERQ